MLLRGGLGQRLSEDEHLVRGDRVLSRPGMTVEKFEHILGLQTPDSIKRERADHVIDTGTSIEATEQAVKHLIAQLRAERT